MNPVRCKHCGRANLPPMPGSLGGAGRLAYPVAHARGAANPGENLEPCAAGVTREALAACVPPGYLAAQIEAEKERIWTDGALWDL